MFPQIRTKNIFPQIFFERITKLFFELHNSENLALTVRKYEDCVSKQLQYKLKIGKHFEERKIAFVQNIGR
jgi:hypothetical protein